MKKVYSVTFVRYTNYMNDTASSDGEKMKYIEVGKEPFLITEDKIDYYMQFSGGIKDMMFVGYLLE